MVKQITVFLIFVISSYFFKFSLIPGKTDLIMGFGICILMLVTIILTAIYDHGIRFRQQSGIIIGFIFLSVFFGAYGALWGHNQSMLLSLWAPSYIYFYLFYYFLHSIRLRTNDLERLIIVMAIIYLIIYFFQYAIYPKILFGARASEERGTVRIFIPGGGFASFIYYYFLQKALTTDKKISALYCLLYFAVPILQGTRSSVSTLLLGTLLFVLLSKQVKSKIIVSILIFAASALIFIVFQEIIMNLIDVSKSQASQEDDDIRVKCIKFFLYEFSPTSLNYWIGNGESHGASSYGMRIFFYKEFYGFYQSDIGIIGEYSKFGVLWIICVFLIFRKLFITKTAPRYAYIKFWAAIQILSEIMGGSLTKQAEIILITSALYIYDVSSFELKNSGAEEKEEILVTG
jgi:hypothetical protein